VGARVGETGGIAQTCGRALVRIREVMSWRG
jgi:hypothetical protein